MKTNRIRTSFNIKPDILEDLKIVAVFENENMSNIVNKALFNYITYYYPKMKQQKEAARKELANEKPIKEILNEWYPVDKNQKHYTKEEAEQLKKEFDEKYGK